MSITRINEFQAKTGQVEKLRDFLDSVVPIIMSSAGCRSCRVLQNKDDSTQFVVIEVWESVDAHKASARAIPAESLGDIMKLLDAPPQGRYFVE